MQARRLKQALSKAQLLTFFGLPTNSKEKKGDLLEQLVQLIASDTEEQHRLFSMFPEELAVEPTELQAMLQCTALERRRWTQEGKLLVLTYRPFRKLSRVVEYPVYDRLAMMAITQDDIADWRQEHQNITIQKRHEGVLKARATRQTNAHIREQQRQTWRDMIAQWQTQGSPELTAILELAYWTVWCSRWAKENQLKGLRASRHADTYKQRKEDWYHRKNRAMHLLARTPLAHLSFYRPPEPHKRLLWLCEAHYQEKREDDFESVWDYFEHNKRAIKTCPQCSYKKEKDYYSLYLLEIQTETIPDLSFSFHIPYPLGKSAFPKPSTLPRIIHVEQEGYFRFGRALLDQERITHREEEVLRYFQTALARVQMLYPSEEDPNGTNDTHP